MKKFLLLFFPSFFFAQTSDVSLTIASPTPICNVGDCTVLNASYLDLKATSAYTVSTINYQPFPFVGGTESGVTNDDDKWSSVISLPFTFSFYGNCYNSIVIGNNGVVSFNAAANTNLVCPWSFTQQIPNASFSIKNAIYGVYQDADSRTVTSPTSSINFLVTGTAPNRCFVINFYHLGLYQCNLNSGLQTSQIVLHETSNIIDVNVQNRQACSTWNSGSGVIGIQNQTGTQAAFPGGKNTGNWSTSNESWRFTPSGNSVTQFSWYKNGVFLTNDNPITVCNAVAYDTNIYTAKLDYQNCSGVSTIYQDVVVTMLPMPDIQNPQNIVECNVTNSAVVDLSQNNGIILQNLNPNNFELSYYLTEMDAINIFNSIINTSAFTALIGTQTIYVRIDNLETGCFYIISFEVIVSPPIVPPTGNLVQSFTTGQTLDNLVVTGQYIQWYDAPTGGNLLPGTTPLENNVTYYASQTVNSCESKNNNSARLSVTAQFVVLSNNEFETSNLSVYPNPAKNKLTVSYNKPLNSLEVYNSIGQKVKTKIASAKTEVLDVLDLQSGVYFIKIYSEDIFTVVKFIKE